MDLVEKTLITIVAEAALEARLLEDLQRAGIRGYTVTSAHGAGVRGGREGDLEGGNVRIESVATEHVAQEFMSHLRNHYFQHYACVAWLHSVKVVRGENY